MLKKPNKEVQKMQKSANFKCNAKKESKFALHHYSQKKSHFYGCTTIPALHSCTNFHELGHLPVLLAVSLVYLKKNSLLHELFKNRHGFMSSLLIEAHKCFCPMKALFLFSITKKSSW
jgi:hypothetical protein